ARLPHSLDELAQPVHETVIANAQKRPARNIADPRRLDHKNPRPSARETLVPIEDILRDFSLFGRAPGNHRRDPGASARFDRPDSNRAQPSRSLGLLCRGPMDFRQWMLYAFGRKPHYFMRRRSTGLPPMR